MSNDTYDREESATQSFQAQKVNILKLYTETDCDIVVAETAYAIDQINEDIKNGFGDEVWKESALIAIKNLEHKGRMALMKRDDLIRIQKQKEGEDALKRPKYSEEVVKAIRFKKAARIVLDDATFEKIKATADLNYNAEQP